MGHVHDYLGAELQRLMQVEAGGVVLATLTGALLGIKSRLARVDGLLPLAELVLSLFTECPGLARWVSCGVLSLVVDRRSTRCSTVTLIAWFVA